MTPQEFETEVRKLRQLQRRFFRCKKDDPDLKKALSMMSEKEKELFPYIDTVLAIRPEGEAHSEREQFFLLVADMVKKQSDWRRRGGGASWAMYKAKEAESMVDKWLAKWDERKAEEKQRATEAEKAKQTRLF